MAGFRRSIRLPDVDYGRTGFYFFTICIENRDWLLGPVVNSQMRLSTAGEIVKEEWLRTPNVRPGIRIDEWQIMPDHFHAIVEIDSDAHQSPNPNGHVGAHRSAPYLSRSPRSLGSMIGQFKSVTTHRINEIRHTPGMKVWQRGYHERIIRNEVELDKLRRYIQNNPKNWQA